MKEILQRFYAGLNQNDIPSVMKLLDPEIVRIEFEGTPSGGTYRGLDELERHIRTGRGTWAEGACTPETFLSSGDKVVVYVHVRVRLKERTDWIEGDVADGFAFRNGKIVEFRSFAKKEEAHRWAGIAVPQ